MQLRSASGAASAWLPGEMNALAVGRLLQAGTFAEQDGDSLGGRYLADIASKRDAALLRDSDGCRCAAEHGQRAAE